jgi:hypothetical protein
VKIASENEGGILTKVSQICVVGWIIIVSEVQEWTDSPLWFGEIFYLNSVLDIMISNDYNMILQKISMQEQISSFYSHVMLYRVSENMINITENQFYVVPKFLPSEWNCGDLHYVNKRRMPGDWNLS